MMSIRQAILLATVLWGGFHLCAPAQAAPLSVSSLSDFDGSWTQQGKKPKPKPDDENPPRPRPKPGPRDDGGDD